MYGMFGYNVKILVPAWDMACALIAAAVQVCPEEWMVDGRSYSETYADHIVSRAKNPGNFVAIRKKVKK